MSRLAKPGDPYIEGTREKMVFEQKDNDDATAGAAAQVAAMRSHVGPIATYQPHKPITIDMLPEPDEQVQAGIAAVVCLRLMGLEIPDIAMMMNSTPEQLHKLLNTTEAQQTYERLYRALISSNAGSLQGRIASYANDAISTVVGVMKNEKARADWRLKAAQDVLDRSGTNPDQFFADNNNQNTQNDDLNIVFTDGSEETKVSVNLRRRG